MERPIALAVRPGGCQISHFLADRPNGGNQLRRGGEPECGEQPRQVTECYNVISEKVAGTFEFFKGSSDGRAYSTSP